MKIDQLIKMANQIEVLFRNEPNGEDAIKGVLSHILRFWDPRMRMQIVAHVNAGGVGLGDIATAAVKRLPPISAKYGVPLNASAA